MENLQISEARRTGLKYMEDENNEADYAHAFTKNSLILDVIFGFLNLTTLKRCRLVCRYWKDISESCFTKKRLLDFKNGKEPSKFLSDFDEDHQMKSGHYRFQWITVNLSDCMEIFHRDLSSLTSLTLFEITVRNEELLEMTTCDLGSLLKEFMLKSLTISCCSSTKMKIPIGKISTVKHLSLAFCILVLETDFTRCSPKYIKLEGVKVQRSTGEGEHVEEAVVNDLFDLNNTEKINIRLPKTKLHLSLVNFIEGPLKCVSVVNVALTMSRRSKVKVIEIYCRNADLTHLPESLENLTVNCHNAIVDRTSNFYLPNLKQLDYAFRGPVDNSLLSLFSTCPKLRSVNLKTVFRNGNHSPFIFNWLPPTVDTLQLENIRSVSVAAQDSVMYKALKNLVFVKCSPPAVLKTSNAFSVENLYLWLDDNVILSQNSQFSLQILKQHRFKKFIVGGFNWEDNLEYLFNRDPLSKFVDKKSTSYSFEETSFGKAIHFGQCLSGTMLQFIHFQNYLRDLR